VGDVSLEMAGGAVRPADLPAPAEAAT
jgi:hypothetical protein